LAEQTRALTALRDDLEQQAKTAAAATLTEQQKRQATEALLADDKQLADTARAKIDMLKQQVEQLQKELSVSEQLRSDEQAKASSLSQQLNLALAAQVEELRKYRSDFFGKLREVLANRPGIQIVGDRFVFQSEVLFGISSAELTPAGIAQMTQLATTFHQIIDKFPPDVNWVLRVDGHTDATPIHNARFASNWELSSARAISVVKFLISQGIPASHLAATGFGENQPVDSGNTPDAFAKNRRIEIRLTDR
jgi:chemotaxis protein MotB